MSEPKKYKKKKKLKQEENNNEIKSLTQRIRDY